MNDVMTTLDQKMQNSARGRRPIWRAAGVSPLMTSCMRHQRAYAHRSPENVRAKRTTCNVADRCDRRAQPNWHAVGVFLIVWSVSMSAFAAKPDVQHLFPAGAQRGQTVEVAIAGTIGPDVQVWVSRDDVTIAMPEKGNKAKITVAANAKSGVCWLRFFNGEGAAPLKPFMIGSAAELLEKEPNDKLDQAQRLESTRVVANGVLSKSGDVDMYAITLRTGQTLVASMLANRRIGSPLDGILQIVSDRGFVLAQNDDDQGFDPQVTYTAKTDGLHYVRAFGFPVTPNSSVSLSGAATYIYRLMITSDAFADHAFPLAVPHSEMTSGKKPTVKIVGWNVPESLQRSEISAPTQSDTYSIEHALLANSTDVRIEPHATGIEQEPNDLDRPNPISIPLTMSGCIEQRGDVDAYRFVAKKGQRLEFRIESRSLGHPLDPVLRLVDAKGATVREVETRSNTVIDEVLTQTIAADGDYRIVVRDLYEHGGFRYVYRLTARFQQPDVAISLAGDVFSVTAGKPLSIPVTVTRQNGFADELELRIDGLPKAVECKPVKSAAKGATAKAVKLVLNVDAKAATVDLKLDQPIRVIARSVKDQAFERIADAPIAGLTEKTSDVWLTVLKPPAGGKPAAKK